MMKQAGSGGIKNSVGGTYSLNPLDLNFRTPKVREEEIS
jgi:hypothetical protein